MSSQRVKLKHKKVTGDMFKVPQSAFIQAVASDKPITRRYALYLEANPDPIYDEWVIERIAEVMRSADRDRSQTWSASSLGRCERKQIFARLAGGNEQSLSAKTVAIFRDGHWRHMRLQADMLQAGIIEDIEVYFEDPSTSLAGTMDGMGDTFGVELKGEQPAGYGYIRHAGGRARHEWQVNSYLLLMLLAGSEITRISLFYEDKASQDWLELVIERDPKVMAELEKRLGTLNRAWNNHELPDRLPDFPTGYECKSCPFKLDCMRLAEGEWIDDLANKPRIKAVKRRRRAS